MCETLEFNGQTFSDQTADWLAPNVGAAQCDQAAANLGLPIAGTEASQQIVDFVRQRGPQRGNDVVEALFGDYRQRGPADINFTTLFRYACQNLDLLRFKQNPNQQNSPLVVAVAEQLPCDCSR